MLENAEKKHQDNVLFVAVLVLFAYCLIFKAHSHGRNSAGHRIRLTVFSQK